MSESKGAILISAAAINKAAKIVGSEKALADKIGVVKLPFLTLFKKRNFL